MVIEMKRPASFRADITVQGTPPSRLRRHDRVGHLPDGTGQPEPMPADAAKEMADQADIDGASSTTRRRATRWSSSPRRRSRAATPSS